MAKRASENKLRPVFWLHPRRDGGYHLLSCKIALVDAEGRVDGSPYAQHPLKGFGFDVQADKETPAFYGWQWNGVGFHPESGKPVDLEAAQRYIKVLKPLGPKIAKLNEQFGYPRDFADHLVRVAAALNVTTVIEHKEFEPWDRLDGYRQYDMAAAAARIRRLEIEWAEQHGKEVAS